MATLTRPWTQYFIIFIIPFVLWSSSLKMPRQAALYMSIGFLAPMSFWIIRNLFSIGALGDDTLTINALYHGLYPGMMYDNNPESLGFPYLFDPRSSEISTSLSSVLMEISRRFRNSPLEYLNWYFLGKPIMLFSWNIYEGMGVVFIYSILSTPYNEQALFKITHWIMSNLNYWFLVFAVFGSLVAWLPNKAGNMDAEKRFFIRCVSALFWYFIFIQCISAPFSRYSIPMQPIIYGMAMYLLRYLRDRLVEFSKNLRQESNLVSVEFAGGMRPPNKN